MAGFFIFIAVLLGAATATFYNAHEQLYYGASWAVNACGTAPLFCSHPEYLAYAAGGSLVLGIGAALGGALSG